MRRCVYSGPSVSIDLLHRHLLLGVTARLLLDADQHVRVGAEALDLHVADADAIQLLAHAGEIGGAALVLHLDERAALEVDAVVEAAREVEAERYRYGDDRQRQAEAFEAHEGQPQIMREEVEALEVGNGEEHRLPL